MEQGQFTESGISPEQDAQDAPAENSIMSAIGGFVGFVLLAAPAVAIIAAVMLLPEYARMKTLEHQRDCQRVENEEIQAVVDGYDRLIAAAEEDEVQVKRLAMSQLGMMPKNEIVVYDPDSPPAPPPGLVTPVKFDRPAPPDDMYIRLADKLNNNTIRRGLLAVAAFSLFGAVMLFGGAGRGKSPAKTPQDDEPSADDVPADEDAKE